MRWAKSYPDLPASLDFLPEFAFREPTIRERLSIEQNAWWKQETVANCERFSGWRLHVEQRERISILDLQTFENDFGLRTELAVLFGQEKDIHLSLCLSLKPGLNIREKMRDWHVHGIVGCATVVRSPLDAAIGTNQNKGVSIAARAHHPVAIGAIGL